MRDVCCTSIDVLYRDVLYLDRWVRVQPTTQAEELVELEAHREEEEIC